MMLGLSLSLVSPKITAPSMTFAQKYSNGLLMGLHDMRTRILSGQSAACAIIGDQTQYNEDPPAYVLAQNLAANHGSTHRVEYWIMAGDAENLTMQLMAEGPDGRQYRYNPPGADYGPQIPLVSARSSIDGAGRIEWEVDVEFDPASLTSGSPSSTAYFIGQGAGSDASVFSIGSNRRLQLTQRKQGGGFQTFTAPANVSAISPGVPVSYKVECVADNGSNSTATFYQSTDFGASWAQLGATQLATAFVGMGEESESPFWLFAKGGAGSGLMGWRCYRAQCRIDSNPWAVLPDRMDAWNNTSGQTNASYLGGSPTIFVGQFAKPFASVAPDGFFTGYGPGSLQAEAFRCWANHLPDWLAFSSSINDTDHWGMAWENQMDAAVEAGLSLYASKPPVIHFTQNPQLGATGLSLVEQHNNRQRDVMRYATKKGRGGVDFYRMLRDSTREDLYLDSEQLSAVGNAFIGNGLYTLLKNA